MSYGLRRSTRASLSRIRRGLQRPEAARGLSGPPDCIYVRDVHKRFGKREVLCGIDLEIARGEVVVVIGRSGSGKTTLLRCLAGLESYDRGEISVFGRPVRHAWRLRGEVGFVFQQFNLFPHKTALGNIVLPLRKARNMSRREARRVALEMLNRVGLEDWALSRPAQLSGGQQQRVAIARALALRPKVMLFDEPTSALDRELVVEVLRVMEDLAHDGMTMIAVTHELFFAERAANRVVFIDNGVIVEEGEPAQVLHEPAHERTRTFLGLLAPDLDVHPDPRRAET